MSYKKNIKNWEGFASSDPLWSILTDPDKKDGKWNVDEFFETGRIEIETILALLNEQSWMPATKESALDFGCGVGRLTRALARHFDSTLGIDAAAGMIEMAKVYHTEFPNVEFKVNPSSDLNIIPADSITFIYSAIVLQHIPLAQAYQFIAEFCRVLKPGGRLVFQVPTADIRKLSWFQKIRVQLKLRERLARLGIGNKYHMDMFVFDMAQIEKLLTDGGCSLLGTRLTNHTDKAFNGTIRFLKPHESTGFESTLFIVAK